eukprot:4242058-Karenia_brevis.AAC.1
MCSLIHWTKTLMWEVIRWERSHLRRVFRMRRAPDEGAMRYNKRTLLKLERWYELCEFKPIHIVLLEQCHANMWHERAYGKAAGEIRRERAAAWWEFFKNISAAKRKREDTSFVHPRTGPQLNIDDLMVSVWGIDWRVHLDTCGDQGEWRKGRRDFVQRACAALDFPAPPKFYLKSQNNEPESMDDDTSRCCNLEDIPIPAQMQRDSLFRCRDQQRQVEFVVDNLAVAGLANSTLSVTCTKHLSTVYSIRGLLSRVYRTCHYKAGFLDPVDWRPREWNRGADHLASYGLANKLGGGTLTAEAISEAFQH